MSFALDSVLNGNIISSNVRFHCYKSTKNQSQARKTFNVKVKMIETTEINVMKLVLQESNPGPQQLIEELVSHPKFTLPLPFLYSLYIL